MSNNNFVKPGKNIAPMKKANSLLLEKHAASYGSQKSDQLQQQNENLSIVKRRSANIGVQRTSTIGSYNNRASYNYDAASSSKNSVLGNQDENCMPKATGARKNER